MSSYTYPDLIQAEIRASVAFDDNTSPSIQDVETWIRQESKIIELRAGAVFGSTLASSTYIDYDGSGILRFPHSPIISISSLKYNQYSVGQSPNWLSLEEGYDKNYLLYSNEAEVEFISGVNATNKVLPIAGKKNICVTYSHGYVAIPDEIQRLATLSVAKRVVMSLLNNQGNTQGGNISVGAITVSDPSSYGVNWFKSVNDEIDMLYKSIGQELKVYKFTRRYD